MNRQSLTPNRFSIALIAAATLAIGLPCSSQAAKAPVSQKQLEKEAVVIITGTVVEVSSKVQRSKIETGIGIHRDRVYRIKLKVTKVLKHSKKKIGDTVEFFAWKPVRRIPPLPGLQGHSPIPKKGDQVKVYLKQTKDGELEPVLPNGITIVKQPDKKTPAGGKKDPPG